MAKIPLVPLIIFFLFCSTLADITCMYSSGTDDYQEGTSYSATGDYYYCVSCRLSDDNGGQYYHTYVEGVRLGAIVGECAANVGPYTWYYICDTDGCNSFATAPCCTDDSQCTVSGEICNIEELKCEAAPTPPPPAEGQQSLVVGFALAFLCSLMAF